MNMSGLGEKQLVLQPELAAYFGWHCVFGSQHGDNRITVAARLVNDSSLAARQVCSKINVSSSF